MLRQNNFIWIFAFFVVYLCFLVLFGISPLIPDAKTYLTYIYRPNFYYNFFDFISYAGFFTFLAHYGGLYAFLFINLFCVFILTIYSRHTKIFLFLLFMPFFVINFMGPSKEIFLFTLSFLLVLAVSKKNYILLMIVVSLIVLVRPGYGVIIVVSLFASVICTHFIKRRKIIIVSCIVFLTVPLSQFIFLVGDVLGPIGPIFKHFASILERNRITEAGLLPPYAVIIYNYLYDFGIRSFSIWEIHYTSMAVYNITVVSLFMRASKNLSDFYFCLPIITILLLSQIGLAHARYVFPVSGLMWGILQVHGRASRRRS